MRTRLFRSAVGFAVIAATLLAALEIRPLRGADCNSNGVEDLADLDRGTSRDCNGNDIPDECELGSGSITFELPRRFISGVVCSMLVEDFDADGDVDVAVAGDVAGDGVRLLRNDGRGNFQAVEGYPVGQECWKMVGADLDLDGDLDLAFGRWDPRYEIRPGIAILRQRADGSFAPPEVVPADGWVGSLSAVDLDGDSDTDLAWSVWRGTDNQPAALASVLFNRGDGTFANERSYRVGDRPMRLAAADLDGDGDVDLVTPNRESEDVSVLLNRGDGTFDQAVEIAAGPPPRVSPRP